MLRMSTLIGFTTLIFASYCFSASHNPEEFAASLGQDKNAGKAVYNNFCANCHAKNPLIEIGAPILGDNKAWEKRKQQGYDTLLKHLMNGINSMPARGGCFECSDEQIKAALNYILE
jgi:cytochrome c5